MIDTHCHLLPGLDDGPRTMDEAVAMCRLAADDGIRAAVCTPHFVAGQYPNTRERILPAVAALQAAVEQAGIPLRLHPGCEIRLDVDVAARVKNGELLSINDNGRYIVLELPHDSVPPNADAAISALVFAGLVPIIAHPEKNTVLQARPGLLHDLVALGALAQLTAGSLTGDFGRSIQIFSRRLLTHNVVHILASDAHSRRYRHPGLSRARAAVAQLAGDLTADNMTRVLPEKIVNGETVEVPSPVPFGRRRSSRGFFKRLFGKK